MLRSSYVARDDARVVASVASVVDASVLETKAVLRGEDELHKLRDL